MVEIGGLSTLVRGSVQQARVWVVLLHGYAMQAADLAPFADSLGAPAAFFFPQGPRPVASGGYGWWAGDPDREIRDGRPIGRDLAAYYPPGRAAARVALARWLAAIAPRRAGRPLLLGGFSQGGMLACDLMLRQPTVADALALLSASRVAFDDWQPYLPRLRALPVLVAHGRGDADLAFAAGEALQAALAAAGASVQWLPFDGGHETPLPVWRALRKSILRLAEAAV